MKFITDFRSIREIMKDCPKEQYEEVRNTVNILVAVGWITGFAVALMVGVAIF